MTGTHTSSSQQPFLNPRGDDPSGRVGGSGGPRPTSPTPPARTSGTGGPRPTSPLPQGQTSGTGGPRPTSPLPQGQTSGTGGPRPASPLPQGRPSGVETGRPEDSPKPLVKGPTDVLINQAMMASEDSTPYQSAERNRSPSKPGAPPAPVNDPRGKDALSPYGVVRTGAPDTTATPSPPAGVYKASEEENLDISMAEGMGDNLPGALNLQEFYPFVRPSSSGGRPASPSLTSVMEQSRGGGDDAVLMGTVEGVTMPVLSPLLL
eukprot:gene25720-11377_t